MRMSAALVGPLRIWADRLQNIRPEYEAGRIVQSLLASSVEDCFYR